MPFKTKDLKKGDTNKETAKQAISDLNKKIIQK